MAMLWKKGNMSFWNLEPCEECVVICAYEQVRGNIPQERTMRDFEHHFYSGNSVKQADLDDLNTERKRLNLPLIRLEETFHSTYTTAKGFDRATNAVNRENYRAKYREADPATRQRMFQVALAEQAGQGPPQMTYDEYMARKRDNESNSLTYNEVARRQTASASVNGKTNGTKLDVERAKIMLAMTNNEAIRDQIMDKLDVQSRFELLPELLPSVDAERRKRYINDLSGEQAYDLANRLRADHPAVVDELLMHSLAHM